MSYSNSKILTNVSVTDVQQALGRFDTSDVGTLCVAPEINMWALRKPSDNDSLILQGNKSCMYTTRYYRSVQSEVQDTACNAVWTQFTNGWTYVRPKGGLHSPYRLGDFMGYYALAVCPCADLAFTETATHVILRFTLHENDDNVDFAMMQTELGATLYLGVCINGLYYFTAEASITSTTTGTKGQRVAIVKKNIPDLPSGELRNYTFRPFLCNHRKTSLTDNTPASGIFWDTPVAAEYTTQIGSFQLSATWLLLYQDIAKMEIANNRTTVFEGTIEFRITNANGVKNTMSQFVRIEGGSAITIALATILVDDNDTDWSSATYKRDMPRKLTRTERTTSLPTASIPMEPTNTFLLKLAGSIFLQTNHSNNPIN